MKHKLIILLLVVSGVCHAQEIATMSAGQSNTIVRQWTDDVSIYYGTSQTQHYFALYDATSPTSVIVADFPMDINVRDFEIFKDVVYFCGQNYNGGNPYAVVGFISISDLFYNNQPYTFGFLTGCYYWPLGGAVSAHLVSAERMDLYSYYGTVHIVFVGESDLSDYYGQDPRRTVCDVYLDTNTSNWVGSMLYNKDDSFSPTDVTCTDECVVVVGDDSTRSTYVVKTYYKNFTSSLFNPVWADQAVIVSDYQPLSPYLIERINNNRVAINYYFYDPPTGYYGTTFVVVDDATQPTFTSYHAARYKQTTSASSYMTWYQYDLRYQPVDDNLVLLHITKDMLITSMKTVFFYNQPLTSPLGGSVFSSPFDAAFFSFDNRRLNLFSASGIYSSGLNLSALLCHKTSLSSECFSQDGLKYINHTSHVKFFKTDFDESQVRIKKLINQTYYPSSATSTVTVNCGPSNDR